MPRRRCCNDGNVSDPHSDILSRESMTYIRSRPYYSRRCKKEMPTNIESLPTDLLFEILLRLPANHLYERARLVCRRWYHIIHSHAFINAQMHGATYGLLLSPIYDNTPLYVTADAEGGIHIYELTYIFKLGVLATCNGLVLELEDTCFRLPRLVIVNPATKKSLFLPPFPRGVRYRFFCSLAYSAASLAYKVIAPYTVRDCAPYTFPDWPLRLDTDYGLDVLTVGVDESWRHVEVHHLPDHVR
ncbi:uncharacterized protein LOC131002885 [Salvia miltiorrhiza]|uniref:uncharacterized protein LOC131002885 n=1 Tax=Salvia miltiorrhiza TaxID=226208 RepID=UPI0025AB9A0E|nr:uncharacterized protein LOC131002885 [Salvia miltiorrhiza]